MEDLVRPELVAERSAGPNYDLETLRYVRDRLEPGRELLYLMSADGSGVQRLTSSAGIDTEANFAADGRSILFTSDRGGSPQIYRLTLGSGAEPEPG